MVNGLAQWSKKNWLSSYPNLKTVPLRRDRFKVCLVIIFVVQSAQPLIGLDQYEHVSFQGEEPIVLNQTILDRSFEITVFPRKWEELKSAVLEAGCGMRPSAEAVGWRTPAVKQGFVGRYAMISGLDLGLMRSAQRPAIYDLARRVNLEECHPQVGWELLIRNGKLQQLQIRDLLIGSTPIEMSRDFFLLLEIRDGQIMNTDAGGAVSFGERREWLFKVA